MLFDNLLKFSKQKTAVKAVFLCLYVVQLNCFSLKLF